MKPTILMVLILSLMILVTGCETENKTAPVQNQEQQEAAQKAAPEQKPKEETKRGSVFSDFGKAYAESTYKVTYDFSSNTVQAVSGTMTMAHKAGKRKIVTQTGQGNSEIYVMESAFYTCSDGQGEMQCFKMAAWDDKSFDTLENAQDNPDDYEIEDLGTRTIAKTKAQCFKVTSVEDKAQSEVCYEEHGVPLYVKTTGTQEGVAYESTMEATSFSLTVADSEFDLPAEPLDMNAMMQQGMPDLSQYQ